MIFRRMNKSALTAGLAAVLLASSAFATPTQGTLGATSTGITNISVTKTSQVQISDLSDMTFGAWNINNGTITMTTNACIYSSTGGYTVTPTGSGTSNAFTIASGGVTIPYSVAWNGGGAGGLANTGTALTASAVSTGFTHASTSSATCGSGGASNDTARVIVTILSSDMIAAPSNATPYTGTLTLLITPN